MSGFVLFLALSTLVLSVVTGHLAPNANLGALAATAGDDGTERVKQTKPAPFVDRVERVTEIANSCFFEEGLSTHHFITNYSAPRTVGHLNYDYLYREIWVPEDFRVDSVLKRLRNEVGQKVQNVTIAHVNLDAKTIRLMVDIDGIKTHRFLFTKATKEAPDGARVLLSYVPDDNRRIDIDAIPKVKYRGAPRVAIIIDDIGYREAVDRLFFNLPAKITFSVLPFSPTGVKLAKHAHDSGYEVMLHMPMEPISYPENDPGKGKLLVSMNQQTIQSTVETNLKQVPYIVGVNNHMGSAFTADAAKMRMALAPIKARNLFFVDSVTIGNSVAYATARQQGLRAAARNLFLDYRPDYETICRQVELAGRIAKAQGFAIAIGHPFENTYRALRDYMPGLLEQGVQFVPVSQLVR